MSTVSKANTSTSRQRRLKKRWGTGAEGGWVGMMLEMIGPQQHQHVPVLFDIGGNRVFQ